MSPFSLGLILGAFLVIGVQQIIYTLIWVYTGENMGMLRNIRTAIKILKNKEKEKSGESY
ncbi:MULTISPECIES: hypothetical protein [Bacillaceae]|jgi:hypothetical protein|uniref:Uncharacterized protein n=2 Tax=Bacillus infantis TaxID=324767 RepID=U5L526_9BACI|nr:MULTISPECIES: hypothetical protein [Bacillus]OXT14655.1 hypothetical protein B9K06_25185 [Bacillus sp. OG2]AGX02373.1 hypothetical protein N288_02030 [Bacillus infantis NRRL B-14911]EAR67520.1 hypothetical protein B14911_19035 [Bacillus sp. NRRL B-14911]MCP1156635.1 hypothetical protein [Bacillus infantis]MDT0161061.1 hypothetical protein [Bacillus sp. AG4(2022)]